MPQTFPLARRQLQGQSRRMGRNALDDIAQVDEGIDLQVLAGLHQRTQNGGAMSGGFTSREQPVFAAKHDRP